MSGGFLTKKDGIAKTNIWPLPPARQYVFSVQFNDGLHYVASLFGKHIDRIKIWILFTLNALITVAIIFSSGSNPNLIKMIFYQPPRRIPSSWSLRSNDEWRAANLWKCKAFWNWSFGFATYAYETGSGIVENLVDKELLSTLFMDWCISRILLTKCKILPWHLNPVTIIFDKDGE